jgi:polyvinyl alcohol dehydrogenase (cytochrome)
MRRESTVGLTIGGALLGVTLGSVGITAQRGQAAAPASAGQAVYARVCASCHAAPAADSRAPDLRALAQRTPESILEAITTGIMAPNARVLSTNERRAVAEYAAGRAFGTSRPMDAASMTNRCAPKPLGDPLQGPMWNGWGADRDNSRYQPASSARLTADQVPKLTLKWAFGLPNAATAYAQPTVVGGRVYVGADTGYVYALDAASGCVYWSFAAQGGVRTAFSVGPVSNAGSARYAVYFGDLRANIYAVNAETGTLLWTHRTDPHPRARVTGAPTLHDGVLYVPVASLEEGGSQPTYECCTFRGSVVAYNASTGALIWQSYTIPEPNQPTKKTSTGTQLYGPAGAAVWSAPTIDLKRGLLYIATSDAYTLPAADTTDAVVAMDLKTGRIVWSKQTTANDAYLTGTCLQPVSTPGRSEQCPDPLGPDFDFGQSPILRTLPDGRNIIVIGQKSGIGWGLDPDNKGAIVWQHRVGKGSAGGGMEFGSAADEEMVYFPNNDSRYGPDEAGGIAAVKIGTGERVWFTRPPPIRCTPDNDRVCVQGQSAAATVIPGVVFSGATNGMMRAYSTRDGQVIWQYDSAHEYGTVNGVPGKGGSINGAGPTVVDGMFFMNSGYAGLSGRGAGAGNVVLAFAPSN